MDNQQIRILRKNLRRLERQNWNSFVDQEGCCGLTLPQCHALLEIADRSGMSLADLASALLLDSSTLSRTIQELVVKGLIDRATGVRDRRSVVISLTGRGREVCGEIDRLYDRYFAGVLEQVPANRRRAVVEAIRTLAQAIGKFHQVTGCCQKGKRR